MSSRQPFLHRLGNFKNRDDFYKRLSSGNFFGVVLDENGVDIRKLNEFYAT